MTEPLLYETSVPGRAACLLGIVDAFQAVTGRRLLPVVAAIAEDARARTEAALAAAEFQANWDEGHRMPLAQAIAYAGAQESPAPELTSKA